MNWFASLGFLPVALCTAFLVASLILGLTEGGAANQAVPPGVDPFTRFLLIRIGGSRARVAWTVGALWLVVSCITNLVIPVAESGVRFLLKPAELIQALNYSLVVPGLFAAYVYFAKTFGRFLSVATTATTETPPGLGLTPSGMSLRGTRATIAGSLLLAFMAFGIDVVITQHVMAQPSGYETWIHDGVLTVAGVYYYAMRGINAFIALGLISAVIGAWWTLWWGFRPPVAPSVIDRGFKIHRSILDIGESLLLAFIVAGLVIILEVSSEVFSAAKVVEAKTKAELFARPERFFSDYLRSIGTEVSWLIFVWIGLYLIGLVVVFILLNRLRSWVVADLDRICGDTIDGAAGAVTIWKNLPPKYWMAMTALKHHVDSVYTWPVPTYLRRLAGGSVVGQFIGPLISAYVSYRLKPK